MNTIDINCDLGEGGKHDSEIMPLISSCNIACGGHFGNKSTILETVKLALKNKINIGAHPSYPDKIGFGRKPFELMPSALKKTISEQIERILEVTRSQNAKLRHVKPHGKLYNDLMTDAENSEILIETILEIDPNLILFVPPNSMVQKLADNRLKIMVEGFADRNYEGNFSLVSRKKKHALLTQKEAVLEHVLSMVKREKIPLKNDRFLKAKFDTFCVHGDTPNCVEILHFLNQKLPKENIHISGK